MVGQNYDLRGEMAALAARIERLEQRIGLEPEPPAQTLYREPDWSLSSVRPPLAIDTLMLERLVGGRWFAAIGSIVVVIGLGLFLKLAIDEGWLARIPPAVKCWAVAGFGLALLGVGEVLHRRIGALASAGPSATGVAAIYAAGYSAYGIYQLLQGWRCRSISASASRRWLPGGGFGQIHLRPMVCWCQVLVFYVCLPWNTGWYRWHPTAFG